MRVAVQSFSLIVAFATCAFAANAAKPEKGEYAITALVKDGNDAAKPAQLRVRFGEQAAFVTGIEGGRMLRFEITSTDHNGKIDVKYRAALTSGASWSNVQSATVSLAEAETMTVDFVPPAGTAALPASIAFSLKRLATS